VRREVVSILVMARNLFLEAPVVCTDSAPDCVTVVWNSVLVPTLLTSSHLLQCRLRTPLTSEFRKQ